MQKGGSRQFILMVVLMVFSLVIVISSIIPNLCKVLFVQDAFATTSPSFQRQELSLDTGQWFDLIWQNSTSSGPNYADIQSVSYSSSGRHLDATLWLAGFETSPNDYENVNYGMYFDADSNNRTGLDGIDYKIEISWNNESRTWTRAFEEWSSNGKNKTLDKEGNATDFFDKAGSYVTMSADLDSMLSPENYRVLFYAEVYNQKKVPIYWIIDSTNWISIPSPELNFVVLPNPIVLVQGEDSIAEVRINSSTAAELELEINPHVPEAGNSSSQRITTKLDSEKLIIPPFGATSTHMRVSIPPDIPPTAYMIMIGANITSVNTPLFAETGITQPGTQESLNNNNAENARSEYFASEYISKKITDQKVSKSAPFSVQVKEWSFEEQLNSFVTGWVTPLTAIYASITSIVAAILGWIYGRRRGGQGGRQESNVNDQNKDNK